MDNMATEPHNEYHETSEYNLNGGSRECTSGKMGVLPACAPLANPYVPFQPEASPQYTARQGIVRGTLFPGLDLPFMGMVNKHELSDTPMHQMQALHFAINELVLYLDTHPDDREALELLRNYNEMYDMGREELRQIHGPQTVFQAGGCESFDWVEQPWPWQLRANEED